MLSDGRAGSEGTSGCAGRWRDMIVREGRDRGWWTQPGSVERAGMNESEADFYQTGGSLAHDAPSYVAREADRQLLDALQRGEFCYILTSRQMGKSSLMVHTTQRLREQGVHVVVMDLTAIGENLSAEQWYLGLLGVTGRRLGLEEELERFWWE